MAYNVGSTYLRRMGDKTEPVTLTSVCEWGGWYGTDDDGNVVRVTDKTLVSDSLTRDNIVNTNTVQEDIIMASNNRNNTVTAADRRAKRAARVQSAEPTPTPSTATATATVEAPKPATKRTPAKRKPAARKTQPTVKITAPKENIVNITDTTPIEQQIKDAAAAMLAKMIQDGTLIAGPSAETTVEPVKQTNGNGRTRKPAAAKAAAKKSVSVTLVPSVEKVHSMYFKYMGTSKTPAVTGCYITNEAIERLEAGETLTANFDRAEGKKPSILFRESDDSMVFNGSLYVMRSVSKVVANLPANKKENTTGITVTVVSKGDGEVTLTISAA